MYVLLFGILIIASAQNKERERKRREAFNFEPEQILGNAGFATEREIKEAGLFSKHGVPCGHSEGGRPMRYDGDAMVITVAPVGSGKGTCLVGPAIMSMNDRSLIILGSKPENSAMFSAYTALSIMRIWRTHAT